MGTSTGSRAVPMRRAASLSFAVPQMEMTENPPMSFRRASTRVPVLTNMAAGHTSFTTTSYSSRISGISVCIDRIPETRHGRLRLIRRHRLACDTPMAA